MLQNYGKLKQENVFGKLYDIKRSNYFYLDYF